MAGKGSRIWGIVVGWGVITSFNAVGLVAAEADAQGGNLAVTVRVYNYAGVSPKILSAAEEETTRVLGAAGIGSEWLDCPVRKDANRNAAACRRPFGPLDLIVRILPEPLAARLPFRRKTLGFSYLPPEGGYGVFAGIFYHKVESLANETRTDRHYILGYAIAHEIGHLLLRTISHTDKGLMRANWGDKELELASQGQLAFARQDAVRLRAEVRRRLLDTTTATREIALSK